MKIITNYIIYVTDLLGILRGLDFLSLRILIPQMVSDSILINNKQFALLASWIDSMNNNKTNFNILRNVYKFNLLFYRSYDGMKIKEFHQLYLNKEPTLVIPSMVAFLKLIINSS